MREAIHDAKGMLQEAGIEIGSQFEIELSHHHGPQQFRRFGAVIINLLNREYCKKLIVVLPGQHHPGHFHKVKEETFHVLHGELDLYLDGHVRHLVAGRHAAHRARARPTSSARRRGCIFEEISTTHVPKDSHYKDRRIASSDPMAAQDGGGGVVKRHRAGCSRAPEGHGPVGGPPAASPSRRFPRLALVELDVRRCRRGAAGAAAGDDDRVPQPHLDRVGGLRRLPAAPAGRGRPRSSTRRREVRRLYPARPACPASTSSGSGRGSRRSPTSGSWTSTTGGPTPAEADAVPRLRAGVRAHRGRLRPARRGARGRPARRARYQRAVARAERDAGRDRGRRGAHPAARTRSRASSATAGSSAAARRSARRRGAPGSRC